MVLGYFFYESVLLGVGLGAAGGIAGNIGQGVVGVVIAAIVAPALRRSDEIRKLTDSLQK